MKGQTGFEFGTLIVDEIKATSPVINPSMYYICIRSILIISSEETNTCIYTVTIVNNASEQIKPVILFIKFIAGNNCRFE